VWRLGRDYRLVLVVVSARKSKRHHHLRHKVTSSSTCRLVSFASRFCFEFKGVSCECPSRLSTLQGTREPKTVTFHTCALGS
jgi:hypothetical protein